MRPAMTVQNDPNPAPGFSRAEEGEPAATPDQAKIERKLAAILVADVVGFSRLANVDKEPTPERLRALRRDLFDPTVSSHGGRVVKSTGDGAIVEFRSAVEAVRWANEFQNAMTGCNVGVPEDKHIVFRIGIHVGDVVEEADGDLMGDGVNIAARLEGLARHGGICLSVDAYRQVDRNVKEQFQDLGEIPLKNIPRPMQVYAWGSGPGGPAPPPNPLRAKPRSRSQPPTSRSRSPSISSAATTRWRRSTRR
jgi:adenylate cyclase